MIFQRFLFMREAPYAKERLHITSGGIVCRDVAAEHAVCVNEAESTVFYDAFPLFTG